MRIQDCINFAKSNPAVFKDWTDAQILYQIVWSIENNAFLWSMDANGNLDGFIAGKPYPEQRRMHIVEVLGNRRFLIKSLRWFSKTYAGWTLEGKRHGTIHAYKDPNKLLCKLSLKEHTKL